MRCFILLIILVLMPFQAYPHRSGCHRWHSCPSDRGTYVCGDLGYCSYCPDNQYCEGGRPRTAPQTAESADEISTDFSCSDNKRYCGEMRSCDEAYFFLSECWVSGLDGDQDGIPCEKLCK